MWYMVVENVEDAEEGEDVYSDLKVAVHNREPCEALEIR